MTGAEAGAPAPERLFVYGSLRPGASNAHVLSAIEGSWARAWVRGRLERRGWGSVLGYPAVVLDERAGLVPGDVLTSPHLKEHWSMLDEFEGDGYRRVSAPIKTEGGSWISAFLYVLR